MTKAEREAVARTLSCTRCGAEQEERCFNLRYSLRYLTCTTRMNGVHEERLEAADRLLAKMKEEGHDS